MVWVGADGVGARVVLRGCRVHPLRVLHSLGNRWLSFGDVWCSLISFGFLSRVFGFHLTFVVVHPLL